MQEDTRQWIKDIHQPDYLDRVRQALKANKMSQAQFARFCHCSPSTVSMYLNGYCQPRFPKYMWQKARDLLGIRYND